MKFSESRQSTVPASELFQARCDPQVRDEACKQSGALSWTVSVSPSATGVRIQVDRAMPPSVPDFVRRFVGEQIRVRQVEEWGPELADGSRHATVSVTILGQPAAMDGHLMLRPDGDGSVEEMAAEVVVSVPFFGSKIEPEIAKVVSRALGIEQDVAERAARHGDPAKP